MTFASGDDIWVDFAEKEWKGEILRVESSGYILCRVHFDDPYWDFGRVSARVDPEQIVAVRANKIRPREETADD